jgi:hypothetical protein
MHLTLMHSAPGLCVHLLDSTSVYESLKEDCTEPQGQNWWQLPSAPAIVSYGIILRAWFRLDCSGLNTASPTYIPRRFPTPALALPLFRLLTVLIGWSYSRDKKEVLATLPYMNECSLNTCYHLCCCFVINYIALWNFDCSYTHTLTLHHLVLMES